MALRAGRHGVLCPMMGVRLSAASERNTVTDASGPMVQPAGSELLPGTKIGRYVILERAGAGGMGVVFSAYDPELDRRVAIKLLAPDRGGDAAKTRLLREAQAMARLSHPNVVPVYDAGTVGGRVFVAMEFVQGMTLRAWLSAETRPWTDIIDALRRAGLGLVAAHDADLVHRDFKPDNVMVGDDGRVRVMDFGLARSASGSSEPDVIAELPASGDLELSGDKALATPLTTQGAMLGTPAYMPPEQLRGLSVDARSDQWSFCSTLYEALYEKRPFQGGTIAAFVLAIHSDGVRPPPEASTVPRPIFEALAKGLSVEPDDRHASMRALLGALTITPRTRRWPMVAAGALLVAGTAAAVNQGSAHDPACDARGEQATAIWSPTAQAQAAAAFEASNIAYANDSWARASQRVTEYVDAWQVEAVRACRAAGPDTAEVDALRGTCLDGHKRRLATVVAAFGEANDQVVRGAVKTAVQLPNLQQCNDTSRLLAAVRPPTDPDTKARVEALRERLEVATAQKISGDYAEGLRLAQAVAQDARDLGYAPLTAEALTVAGSFAARSSEPEAAHKAYREAFELAAANRDDQTAAEAAGDLIYILGNQMRQPDAARVWTTVGLAMIERAGANGKAPEASLRNAMGTYAYTKGDYERASTEFSRARDIWLALPGDYPIDLAFVYSNIGAVQATLGNYDEARDQHRKALKIREETFGPEHPEVAMSLGNLGIAAFKKGDMVAARDYQERGLAIKRATLPPGHLSLAANAINLGLVFARTGELQRAIELYEQARDIRIAKLGDKHPEVAAALSNLGGAYSRLDDGHAKAEAMHRQALAIREEALGPKHALVANSLQNLTEALLQQDRGDEALPLAERALAIYIETIGPDHAEVAKTWVTIGRVRAATGDIAGAITSAEEAVATARRSNLDAFGLARLQVQLGQFRWREGSDRASARALVEQAVAIMRLSPDREPEQRALSQAWLDARPLP